ncbi:MAG: hypothetical protein WDA75_04640 [Candidatus Latescibacterota bacterium]|jgi:hypothetical protein
MSEATPQQDRVLGNIGVLDLRAATEASIAPIRRIGNVGLILTSPATRHLVARLNMGNVGTTLSAPAEAKIHTGQVEITRDYFSGQTEPQSLIVTGQLLIRPEVTAEALTAGLDQLAVCGQVLCPEPLVGALRAKLIEMTGVLQTYQAHMEVVVGNLRFDRVYLEGLKEGSALAVIGHLEAPEILDDGRLARGLTGLTVLGKLTCREENLSHFRGVLSGPPPQIASIPAGFEPLAGSVVLDPANLGSLPGRRLYCPGGVRLTGEVEPAQLDQALERLQLHGLLIAPARLREVLARKCDLLQTKAVFYEGELWLIDESTTLVPARFDYLEGKATLVVRDRLEITPDLEPRVLADRLDKVHNLDCIRCTPAQMAALQARLGLNQGEFQDSTRPDEEDEEESGIGNVGVLRL